MSILVWNYNKLSAISVFMFHLNILLFCPSVIKWRTVDILLFITNERATKQKATSWRSISAGCAWVLMTFCRTQSNQLFVWLVNLLFSMLHIFRCWRQIWRSSILACEFNNATRFITIRYMGIEHHRIFIATDFFFYLNFLFWVMRSNRSS